MLHKLTKTTTKVIKPRSPISIFPNLRLISTTAKNINQPKKPFIPKLFPTTHQLFPTPSQNLSKSPLYIQKRHYNEYERPFSYFKGTLEGFMVGSRRNYIRPSVTYAAGLGNTTMRHTRLHVEDYTHAIPAHRALPQYIINSFSKRPGLYMSIGILLSLSLIWDRRRQSNELYEHAVDSIFALKAKNFLIKQGERIFLETVLIMLHEGVIEPLEVEGENAGQAEARFVGEIQTMLAEIERHRDFRLSNIPINFLTVQSEIEKNQLWYEFKKLLSKPWAIPFHALSQDSYDAVEFDTPSDIIREQRSLIENYEDEKNFYSKLDSAGVGSLYGLFYPLITRYHHTPIELSIQGVPQTMQRSIRLGTAPLSKSVGREKDRLMGSVLFDQFQVDKRNEELAYSGDEDNPGNYRLKLHHQLPKYWDSDIEAELYNSYYLQRATNLIKCVNDIDGKVATSMFGETNLKDVLKAYLSKPHRVLLERHLKGQLHEFSPGDNHLFRYYYQKYNLVPYLNSLQYEMQELILLRQRLMKIGKAVGVDSDLESFSNDVLRLLDPYDTKPKSGMKQLTFKDQNGNIITLSDDTYGNIDRPYTNNEVALQNNAPQLQHIKNINKDDITLKTPMASMSFESTSTLSNDIIQLTDNSSNYARGSSRHRPKLPVALTSTVSSLYQPVKIHTLIETIQEHQYNIKGLNILVDSIHNAQLTDTPKLYPCLGIHPPALSQEKYYIRSLFNPLQNSFGVTRDEKYLRGLLGCIDFTLMRNAAEYQRWVHLVPIERKTLWSKLRLLILNEFDIQLPKLQTIFGTDEEPITSKDGYLNRYKLPKHLQKGYKGRWIPYTSREDVQIHKKPIYYTTQVMDESWGEMVYRLLGWDYYKKSDREYLSEAAEFLQLDSVDNIKEIQQELPLGNTPGQHITIVREGEDLRNTLDDGHAMLEQQRRQQQQRQQQQEVSSGLI